MNFDPKKTVFLIDGSSFLYRAYYSMRPLHAPSGEAVQAVYGFARMIKKLLDTFQPEQIVLVWDSKGKTIRHEMFEEYKATRQAPPSDLFEQKKHIAKFAELIGLKQIAVPGIEADDIMYSIAKERREAGDHVVFVTSDKDMAQALDERTYVYDTFKDLLLDPAKFEKKMGFPVAKLSFYFALLGDASDNIPGVKGVGQKGASDLVTQFASLDDMYANLDKVAKPAMRRALTEQKENAYLSLKLFLLQYQPSGLTKEDLAFEMANWAGARPLFEELNFKSMVKDIDGAGDAGVDIPSSDFGKKHQTDVVTVAQKEFGWHIYDFKSVTTEAQLDELCALLTASKAFAVDTETTGLRPLQDDAVGMSFCMQKGQAFYVPFGHKPPVAQMSMFADLATDLTPAFAQLPRDLVIKKLKPILENASIAKYLHNTKFDQLVFLNLGINLQGVTFDSMIAACLLAKEWQRAGLKFLSDYYFQEPMLSFADMVKVKKLKDFSYVAPEDATVYAAADAHQTFRLQAVLAEKLAQEPKLLNLFKTIEMPMAQILTQMEATGIVCDPQLLKDLGVEVNQKLIAIEAEIAALVGANYAGINLNSPKQVGQLLFEGLQLPTQKKSGKGNVYSTDQEVLDALAPLHPVPSLIKTFRELSKLLSTYIDALPTHINPKTNRIHTTYNQIAVATGRLASAEPNLQNIPTASGFGIAIRAAFKPKPGNVFLSADYSQIELRVLAHLSGDANLVQAFLQGNDIHAETASRLFGVPLDQVTHAQRQIGKRINFSILYGLTPYGLSKDLGVPFKEAKQYIDIYFAQYPGVLGWMEKVVEQTKEHGYVETLWGRRRYLPAIHESNKALYEEARRVAINTCAQGTAAEIMKLGMINLNKALREQGLGAKMLLQIHDELLISVPEAEVEKTEKLVRELLEGVVDWQVPLVVTTRVGADWRDITK